uniref:coagulation factor Xa n=1 Tax=Sphaeramia orbicularis TaxID=375764 RepID=A0A673AGU6_9TELE
MFRFNFMFLDGDEATQVLRRRTRANSFLEELKAGNMERECMEEVCDWEEAREIFENKEMTSCSSAFADGDACQSVPCANGGTCKDGIGNFTCYCRDGYTGVSCHTNVGLSCEHNNGGCEHFCNEEETPKLCSCADGYFLASDNQTCQSSGERRGIGGVIMVNVIHNHLRNIPGNMTDNHTTDISTEAHGVSPAPSTPAHNDSVRQIQQQGRYFSPMAGTGRRMDGDACPPGECPWQALLMNEDDVIICGGTILNQYLILTAAHCLNQSRYIYVVVGEWDRLVNDGSEAVHSVEAVVVHQHYKADSYLNNIALLKLATPIQFSPYILPACLPTRNFAEKVLMEQDGGMVSGFGTSCHQGHAFPFLRRLKVPFVDRITCRTSVNFRISFRMFCAGYDTVAEQCYSDMGGPHVTRYHNTYFITGVACYPTAKYGVYTNVAKYLSWIRSAMETVMPQNRSNHQAPPKAPSKTLDL